MFASIVTDCVDTTRRLNPGSLIERIQLIPRKGALYQRRPFRQMLVLFLMPIQGGETRVRELFLSARSEQSQSGAGVCLIVRRRSSSDHGLPLE